MHNPETSIDAARTSLHRAGRVPVGSELTQQWSILVAIDPPSSLPDLTSVVTLALATGYKVDLVHAAIASRRPTGETVPIEEQIGDPPWRPSSSDGVCTQAYEELTIQAKTLAEQRIDVDTHVLMGPPIDVVLTVAKTLNSVMIVVAGDKHHLDGRTILGSFTSTLLRVADRPVLVLPAGKAHVDPGLNAAVDRLIELIDREEEAAPLTDLRAAARAQLRQPTSDRAGRHLGERLIDALHRFETTHPTLTAAINDVSYYLSGMGI